MRPNSAHPFRQLQKLTKLIRSLVMRKVNKILSITSKESISLQFYPMMMTLKEETNWTWVPLIRKSLIGLRALTPKKDTSKRRTRPSTGLILWTRRPLPSSSRPSKCATSPRCTAPPQDSTILVIRSRVSSLWARAKRPQWNQITNQLLSHKEMSRSNLMKRRKII